MKKKSRHVTLESVKQTFLATELNADSVPKDGRKSSSKQDKDGLLVEESDDSDYDPDKAEKENEDKARL